MTDELLKAARNRLTHLSSIDDARNILTDLDAVDGSEATSKEIDSIREQAVQYLREVTASDPSLAAVSLRRDALPRCLPLVAADGALKYSHVVRIFGEWLNELPEEHRSEVRNEAVAAALEALDNGRARSALRLIATIGFANGAALARVEELIARSDDLLGDHALSVRAALGVSPESQLSLKEALHQRISQRWNVPLASAAKALGDVATVDQIFSCWLGGSRLWPEEPHLYDFTLSIIYSLVRNATESAACRIWDQLLALQDTSPSTKRDFFRIGSPGVTFDCRGVVPEYVRRISFAEPVARYSFYSRLSECLRPHQLDGWLLLPPRSLDIVRQDATDSSGMTASFTTVDLRRKLQAWNVLLSTGRAEELPPLEDALTTESSGFALSELLGVAACIHALSFSRTAARLLKGPLPGREWSANEYLAAHIGAINAALGAASGDAFDALLQFRPPRDGILLSVIEALATTTVWLARSGDREPLSRLLRAAEGEGDKHIREAAADALGRVYATDGMLSESEAARIESLAVNRSVNPYSRRILLYGLAGNHNRSVDAGLLDKVAAVVRPDYALTESEQQAGIVAAAHAVLALRGECTDELAEQIGLVRSNSGYVPGSDTKQLHESSHLIGLLFQRSPLRFAQVAAAIIRTGDPIVVGHILFPVRGLKADTPPVVVNAIIERLGTMGDGRITEPAVLETLAITAPSQLLRRPWGDLPHWMPQARAALAATLATIGMLPEELEAVRVGLLAKLACDGVYAVRRAAYRAFHESATAHFLPLVSSWSVATNLGGEVIRRRAAEASGWLSTRAMQGPIAALGWDVEPAVREAYRKAQEGWEERRLADQYLVRVLAVSTPSDVMREWRFGEALGRLGDDRTVDVLENRAADDIPPSVRCWVLRVQKAVKRRWDEVTRKWPEPWYVRRSVFEPLAGKVRSDDGTVVEVSGYMWLTTPEPPEQLYSWGGWIIGGYFEPGEHHLVLVGRDAVPIMVTSCQLPAGTAVFSGNGPYPGLKATGDD